MRTVFATSIVFANHSWKRDTVGVTSTRRERLRAATIDEIKQAALAQIARVGASALSIRAVAREIGMSPAGLYRYYDGRDALLTDLLTDAYNDLADAVATGVEDAEGGPVDRFAAGVRAYRRWALEQPNRFLLIFGTPVPGYAAPIDGPTTQAHQRMGQVFFSIAGEGLREGGFSPTGGRPPTQREEALAEQLSGAFGDFPASLIGPLLGTWAHWHGLVALEVTHQFDWIYPDQGEAFFEGELARMIAGLGFTP